MTKQALPAVTEITDAEHESFKTSDKMCVSAKLQCDLRLSLD